MRQPDSRILPGPRCAPGSLLRFPAEEAFEFEPPAAVRETAVSQRIEVGRVTAEVVQGIVIGGLLTPLGLTHAICA